MEWTRRSACSRPTPTPPSSGRKREEEKAKQGGAAAVSTVRLPPRHSTFTHQQVEHEGAHEDLDKTDGVRSTHTASSRTRALTGKTWRCARVRRNVCTARSPPRQPTFTHQQVEHEGALEELDETADVWSTHTASSRTPALTGKTWRCARDRWRGRTPSSSSGGHCRPGTRYAVAQGGGGWRPGQCRQCQEHAGAEPVPALGASRHDVPDSRLYV